MNILISYRWSGLADTDMNHVCALLSEQNNQKCLNHAL